MKRVFFIAGPTAASKSELAAFVARAVDAEIVSADAFQIYRGLDLLTAKPDAATLAKAPHHLIGTIPLAEELSVGKFSRLAQTALREIAQRGKPAIVAGGSGLYVKALTHGLADLPAADRQLRAELNQATVAELYARLATIDPEMARTIDRKNPRRLIRALEICLLTRASASKQRTQWETAVLSDGKTNVAPESAAGMESSTAEQTACGVFVFRDREELYQRIDRRVESMFAQGVVAEVRALGQLSSTAEKTLGLREIRQLIAGEISEAECIASIQRATRRYAKRQLTWFRRQSNFPSLNLSLQSSSAAIEWISREARLSFAPRG